MVLEALRDLVHVRIMSVGDAPPIKRRDYLTDSSLEPTLSKPFLEALILTGHPIARRAWYPKDYFDRLLALKHLTIRSGLKMQSGNSKVSSDSFSHIALLCAALPGMAIILQAPIGKPSLRVTVALFDF